MSAVGGAATICVRNLAVDLNGRKILRDISLDVAAGEFVVLMGPNGAGKSTLLRAMAGLVPVSGTIDFGGRRLASLSLGQRSRLISLLPQGGDVSWPMPAHEVVALGRLPHRTSASALSPQDLSAIDRAIQRCGIAAFLDRPATELSGGERKRVLLARLLAVESPIVLADEPTSSLDPFHQIEILSVLRDEAAAGRTVISAVHEVGLALQFATRVVAIRNGAIMADASPAEFSRNGLLNRLFDVVFETARFWDGTEVVAPRPRV